MEARKMFEELGYRCYKTGASILYINYSDDKGDRMIEFYYSNFTFDAVDKNCGPLKVNVKELEAINKQCKELGWLEEKDEHFEEKAETNAEHYLNDLLKIGRHFCFMHGKVKNCCDVGCAFCTFGKENCDKERFKWLASPYKKPPYKLSQFEYDLIQTYSDYNENYKLSRFNRLIKLKDKGYFKCADYDTKIQDILSNCEVIKQ